MDSSSSLLWHGPAWFAGRSLPGSAGPIPGLSADVDLIAAFEAATQPPSTLPCVVLVDVNMVNALNDPQMFWNWLTKNIAALKTDVPVLLLCAPGTILPQRPRADAVLDSAIPDYTLFDIICDVQRALMRSEEARLRRLSFGRIPGYGTAAHYKGASGVLVIGMGGRFLQVQQASQRKVEVIGAFSQQMGEDYLAQRAFDAVILDSPFDETLENLHKLRMDARFASLPAIAITEIEADVPTLYRAGATDVLKLPLSNADLPLRLAAAIRSGKRRRLADKTLAESHKWLAQQLTTGGVSQDYYARYLKQAGAALKLRGLEIWEMKLMPENFSKANASTLLASNLYGTVLSIAAATSREEDLVCFVHDVGPIAVLKSERGKENLQARINAILGHTLL